MIDPPTGNYRSKLEDLFHTNTNDMAFTGDEELRLSMSTEREDRKQRRSSSKTRSRSKKRSSSKGKDLKGRKRSDSRGKSTSRKTRRDSEKDRDPADVNPEDILKKSRERRSRSLSKGRLKKSKDRETRGKKKSDMEGSMTSVVNPIEEEDEKAFKKSSRSSRRATMSMMPSEPNHSESVFDLDGSTRQSSSRRASIGGTSPTTSPKIMSPKILSPRLLSAKMKSPKIKSSRIFRAPFSPFGIDGSVRSEKETSESTKETSESTLSTEGTGKIRDDVDKEIKDERQRKKKRSSSRGKRASFEKSEYERMKIKMETLEETIKTTMVDRGEFESTMQKNTIMEKELKQAGEDLVYQEEFIMKKEDEVKTLQLEVSKIEKELKEATEEKRSLAEDRKYFESSMESINNDLDRSREANQKLETECGKLEREASDAKKSLDRIKKETEIDKTCLVEKHRAERQAKDEAETRCTELELHLEAALNEKEANKDAADRCLELENHLQAEKEGRETAEEKCRSLERKLAASIHQNKNLTSLLRQKSSQIQSMDKNIDEVEELKDKALNHDEMVLKISQLEYEVSETKKLNDELMEEKDSLSKEIANLNSTNFDAELEKEVEGEEMQNIQKQNEWLIKHCKSLETQLVDMKEKSLSSSPEKTPQKDNDIDRRRRNAQFWQRKLNHSFNVRERKDMSCKNGFINELNSFLGEESTELKTAKSDISTDTQSRDSCDETSSVASSKSSDSNIQDRCTSIKEEELEELEEMPYADSNPEQTIKDDARNRKTLIIDELDRLVSIANEKELNEDIDEASLKALAKGAMKVCYIKKYYDVLKDEFTYLPSVIRTCLDYSLQEAANPFYLEEEDEFPMDTFAALRTVAAEALKDEGDYDNDDDYAAKLAISMRVDGSDSQSQGSGSSSNSRGGIFGWLPGRRGSTTRP